MADQTRQDTELSVSERDVNRIDDVVVYEIIASTLAFDTVLLKSHHWAHLGHFGLVRDSSRSVPH